MLRLNNVLEIFYFKKKKFKKGKSCKAAGTYKYVVRISYINGKSTNNFNRKLM